MRGTVYKQAKSPYWWVSFWQNGRRYSRSSGILRKGANGGKEAARDVLSALMGESRRGISPNADRVSLADLERLVVANLEMNGRRSVDRAKRAYMRLKEHLAATPALQIPPILDEYIAKRRADKKDTKGKIIENGAAAATVRQELRWLGRGYRLACEKGLLPYRPPLPAITVSNARQGFVTEEQLETLIEKLPEHLKAPTRFAFLTAWRKEEVFTLRWSSIDLENGTARVEASQSKTGVAREFPFGAMPDLEALILEQRAETTAWERLHGAICPWVFHRDGNRISYIYDDWRKAAEAAMLEVLFHDLRRSGIRQMEIAGVARSTAMKLSGHKTESTYTRYAITAKSDLEVGVAKIAALRAARKAKTG